MKRYERKLKVEQELKLLLKMSHIRLGNIREISLDDELFNEEWKELRSLQDVLLRLIKIREKQKERIDGVQ